VRIRWDGGKMSYHRQRICKKSIWRRGEEPVSGSAARSSLGLRLASVRPMCMAPASYRWPFFVLVSDFNNPGRCP
jgi:hypothetical protein